jgi:Rhodanese-like domain
MRYLASLAANLLIVLALFLTASAGQGPGGTAKKPDAKAPAPAQPAPSGDGVTRITPAEARDFVEKGRAIIVDVRGEESYRIGHVKGALWMPDVASRIKELPRDKMIITYCS